MTKVKAVDRQKKKKERKMDKTAAATNRPNWKCPQSSIPGERAEDIFTFLVANLPL